MNLKDLLLPFSFALLSTWLIMNLFQRKTGDALKPGAEFTAPQTIQASEPLDLDVSFVDKLDSKVESKDVSLDTSNALWRFTNNGGAVDYLAFKRLLAGKPGILETITSFSQLDTAKEMKSFSNQGLLQTVFLVALGGTGNTPYYYNLVEHKKENNNNILVYRAETDKVIINKEFIISSSGYNLKLKLSIEPKGSESIKPRVFFAAPFIGDSDAADLNSGLIFSDNKIIKKSISEIALKGWSNPSLFGVQDRYFAFVLFNDKQGFTQRAYFRPAGERLIAILEGPAVKSKTEWTLEFFCGPKESEILSAVDPRMDQLLDYGWLSFISKPLLWLLKLLYSYIGNYGFAIIILIIILKLLMLPLTLKGEQSLRKQGEIQKKLKYIEQRYKDQPEILAQERADIFKKHGSSMLGCFPLLLQVPIWFGFNKVLSNALELYKAPFLWIGDLSAKDPYFILPIFMGLGMIFQTGSRFVDARQSLMNILLAIVVTAFFSSLSAGLTLFIAVSTWLGVLQTMIYQRLNK